jgi:hypothetical protein
MTAALAPQIAVYLVALLLLTSGGNTFCRILLRMCGLPATPQTSSQPGQPPAPPPPSPQAGRIIGSLERTIVMIGLVAGSWEIMVAVIALKTVARFKDLDERIEAEYFLVGSLASIFWAIAVTTGTLWYDRSLGLDIGGAFATIWKPGSSG